eukprot:206918_1
MSNIKMQKISKFQKNIEASFDALERMNFDIETYLDYLKEKYCSNIDEKENNNNQKISLLVDISNNNMCNKGHNIINNEYGGQCYKCGDEAQYLCWSCRSYDKKYDKNNVDNSYCKYKWCKDCSFKNAENIKNIMKKRETKQAEIIAYYNKNPEISADLLCGLPSKLALEYLLAEIVVSGHVDDYTLYLFDIDNFKQLNKAMGHNGADQKLKEIGGILKECTDKPATYWHNKCVCVDRVWSFRQGGDEFCMITKGKGYNDNKLEKGQIATQKGFVGEIKEKINRIGINISIGVLCYGNYVATRDSEKWLDLCDSALYMAKTVKGKNSLKIYDGGGFYGKEIIDSFETIKLG